MAERPTPLIHDREQAIQTVLAELTFSKQDGLSLPPTYEDQEIARRIVDALGIGQPDGQKITHGRHCTCGACAAEDWTNPDLAPCGMHGADCPALYQPWGRAGESVPGQPDPEVEPEGFPDSHREIPQRLFPEGVGPGGFDIDLMRSAALAANLGLVHEFDIKPWVALYLLDGLERAERAEERLRTVTEAAREVVDTDAILRVLEPSTITRLRAVLSVGQEQDKP